MSSARNQRSPLPAPPTFPLSKKYFYRRKNIGIHFFLFTHLKTPVPPAPACRHGWCPESGQSPRGEAWSSRATHREEGKSQLDWLGDSQITSNSFDLFSNFKVPKKVVWLGSHFLQNYVGLFFNPPLHPCIELFLPMVGSSLHFDIHHLRGVSS